MIPIPYMAGVEQGRLRAAEAMPLRALVSHRDATFVVRGRAGRYEVIFDVCGARCSCKDNQFHWATTACKHQLFVLMRVFGVPVDDISSLTVTDMQELLTTQRD